MTRNVFSEDTGVLDDGFQNAADVDKLKSAYREDINDRCVARGVLMLTDCPKCGVQWKGLLTWAEIHGFFMGHQVPNTKAGPTGVMLLFGCRKCGNASPLNIGWDEVERYVSVAVKNRWMPQTVYAARAEEARKRAAAAAGRR
jgi:hypothetical protein